MPEDHRRHRPTIKEAQRAKKSPMEGRPWCTPVKPDCLLFPKLFPRCFIHQGFCIGWSIYTRTHTHTHNLPYMAKYCSVERSLLLGNLRDPSPALPGTVSHFVLPALTTPYSPSDLPPSKLGYNCLLVGLLNKTGSSFKGGAKSLYSQHQAQGLAQ